MSAAEAVARRRADARRAAPRWPAGARSACSLLALLLRLVGCKTGLPYVYNADENSHFVPRAIGMFGHALNPDYFINPPAYTYVVHVLYALRWGTDPATIGGAFAADPTTAFAIARAASALLGALAVAADRDRRRAAVRRPPRRRSSPARCWRSRSCRCTTATSRSTTRRRWRRWRCALVGVAGHLPHRPHARVRAGRASRSGVAIATKYTAGIVRRDA